MVIMEYGQYVSSNMVVEVFIHTINYIMPKIHHARNITLPTFAYSNPNSYSLFLWAVYNGNHLMKKL